MKYRFLVILLLLASCGVNRMQKGLHIFSIEKNNISYYGTYIIFNEGLYLLSQVVGYETGVIHTKGDTIIVVPDRSIKPSAVNPNVPVFAGSFSHGFVTLDTLVVMDRNRLGVIENGAVKRYYYRQAELPKR